MNILFLTFAYLPSTGGVQRSVHNLAREMVSRGHRVTIATDGPWSGVAGLGLQRGSPADVLVLKIPPPYSFTGRLGKFVRDCYNVLRLVMLCRRRRIDVVHCHLINVDTRYAVILKKFLGIRMVVTLRGNELSTWIHNSPRRREYVRAMLRSADAVTALTQTQLDDALRLEPRMVRHTALIRNPADAEAIVSAIEADTVLPTKPYLLYVGRFVPFKSIDTLIQAYHQTIAQCASYPLDLVLAGVGEEEGKLREQAASGPAAARIRFVERQRWGQALALIQAAECLVLPSFESEGCPNVLLEAMALGTPVVVSDNSRLLEMVQAGVNGEVFRRRDTHDLQAVLERFPLPPEVRDAYAEQGQRRLKTFHGYGEIVSAYEDLYSRLSPPAPSPQEQITFLMPCKSQKKEFFFDAARSVLQQTSPSWQLLILTDPSTPAEVGEWAASLEDPRVRIVEVAEAGFARALNCGLEEATTPFVAILLSDDRLRPHAVSTLLRYRRRFPDADFFHSSRQCIGADGAAAGAVMRSQGTVSLSDFSSRGCPVKHLLCWRRELSMAIGGMNESLSEHGCDDYDFPWRMAEEGARFQAIPASLYEYRLHRDHARLTTVTPVASQLGLIRQMFASHAISPLETDRYLQRAARDYLVVEATGQELRDNGTMIEVCCLREAGSEALPRFLQAGIPQRDFFPHRVLVLPKGGPDGMKLARAENLTHEPARLREMVLYAAQDAIEHVPATLNWNDDVQWHQQQFGWPAQVAAANFVVKGTSLICYVLVSDLVQRIARAPQHRTRVDKVFHGWCRMLVNALITYAQELGLSSVHIASSALVLGHCDPARSPKPELYERVYDDVPKALGAKLQDGWWQVGVEATNRKIAALERKMEVRPWPRTVCILHDTEQGFGHRDTDPAFAPWADEHSSEALDAMLAAERKAGVHATYSVVGSIFDRVAGRIKEDGHALAFHSYDHRIAEDRGPDSGEDQLWRCREVDYRVKGYRPPQSKLTRGVNATTLSYYNFEWLASSCSSLGQQSSTMRDGIVWIPVHLDDYALYQAGVTFEEWQAQVFRLLIQRNFVVIGLHDCYGHLWTDQYESFLRRLKEMASFMTLDEVAATITRGHADWF